MGMGGGPSGTTTTTQNQVPWDSGNLQEIHNSAMDAMRQGASYYPGTTYAPPNALTINALQDAGNTGALSGQVAGGLTPQMQGAALSANTALAGGSGLTGAAPWLDALSASLSGGNPSQASIDALMGLGTGTAAQDLGATAGGAFLGSNPFLSSAITSATDPLVRQYQTAVDPGITSQMNAAGRFGSGSMTNQQSTAQANLGKAIGDISSGMSSADYEAERNRMLQAGSALGSLQEGAYNAAGNLGIQGQNASTATAATALDAYNKLLAGQQSAINASVPLSGLYSGDYNTAVNSGSQIQQLDQAAINDAVSRFYGEQQAKWGPIQQAAQIFGTPIIGQSQTTQPYFSPSPLAQGLGLVSGGLGIAKSLAK